MAKFNVKANGREKDQLRQKLERMFRQNGLKIEVVTDTKIVEFLDIKFNMSSREFRPYRKPNDTIKFVNYHSNHPPACLKNLPLNVEDRLTRLSCNEKVFNEEKEIYQQALRNSNYKHTLKYNPKPSKNKGRKRRRDIYWYNPPWSKNVKTPIAEQFLKTLDHYFPRDHPLHKWLNRSTIKVSYRTTRNLKAYVDGHNRKLLQEKQKELNKKCNCRRKKECPLDGHCQISDLVYQADVKTEKEGKELTMTYFGQTCRKFKKRFYEHKMAFKNKKSKAATALSNYIHKLKDEGRRFTVKWSIKSRAPKFNSSSRKCRLCIREKCAIALHEPRHLLNSRNELCAKCIHLVKYELRKNG